MNSFELNKIMGAVLGTLLFVMGLNVFSGLIFAPHKLAVPGYDLPAPAVEEASAAGADQTAQAEPLPILLASASIEKGQATAKKCQACHNFDKGGPNKIGPNLYGVISRAKGTHEGFAYSSAMKGKGGDWSFDELYQFLANPKGYVPGTIMAFAGISSPKERADVVRYLDSLSDNPVPLPKPEAAAAPAPGAAPAPSTAQSTQQPTPPMPGQRAEPGQAPIQANPQPAPGAPATGATPAPADSPSPAPTK